MLATPPIKVRFETAEVLILKLDAFMYAISSYNVCIVSTSP